MHQSRGKDEASKEEMYHQLKTAAETGWDFSSRLAALLYLSTSNLISPSIKGNSIMIYNGYRYVNCYVNRYERVIREGFVNHTDP